MLDAISNLLRKSFLDPVDPELKENELKTNAKQQQWKKTST